MTAVRSAVLLLSLGLALSGPVRAEDTGLKSYPLPGGKLVRILSLDDRYTSGYSRVFSYYWVARDAEEGREVWRPVEIRTRTPQEKARYHAATSDRAETTHSDWELVPRKDGVLLINAYKVQKEMETIYDETPVRVVRYRLRRDAEREEDAWSEMRFFDEEEAYVTPRKYRDAAEALREAVAKLGRKPAKR